MTPIDKVRAALDRIAKCPDLPNPERDADWKNCQKWSSHDAKEALSELDGMVIVPAELSHERGDKYNLIGEFFEEYCVKGEYDYETVKVPVTWTTIKNIHRAIIAPYVKGE